MPASHDQMRISITDDESLIDAEVVHGFLSQQAYWAKGRSSEAVRKSMQNSLCFGVLDEDRTVGFARVVTDDATMFYLCDLFLLPGYQGRGIGPRLIRAVLDHPRLADLYGILLTRDHHGLYARFGFSNAEEFSSRFMFRKPAPPS